MAIIPIFSGKKLFFELKLLLSRLQNTKKHFRKEIYNKVNKFKKELLNKTKEVEKKAWTIEALNDLIVDSIQDIKGKNIIKLDLRKLEDSPTDYFIICEGDSNTQVKAISDNIHKRMKYEAGNYPSHIEGEQNAHWILLDFFNTVVHVFHKEKRKFYELENLWSDAVFTEYESL